MNHATPPLSYPEISKFCYIKKYRYRLRFDTWFLILTVFEFLNIFLIKMVTILLMSAKMAALGLLKIKVFWIKGYDVIISVHDVTNKILSRASNYIKDVFMWPKFGNSSISSREVIITSTLYSGLSLIRTLRGNLNLFELWRVRIRGSRSFLKYCGNRNRYYQPE